MGIPQWQRAQYIVQMMNTAQQANMDIVAARSKIKRSVESRFQWCHDCLLLAVYGFYKNGLIENTIPVRLSVADLTGFNGSESENIRHAFDALALLQADPSLTATKLKRKLGGEQSIYSFVTHYFNNNLIRAKQ